MKHMLTRWGWITLLLAGTLVQAQQAAAPLYLTFVPNIQFAPVYVAIENGYFEQAGQPVRVEYLSEPDVVDLVAAGQADYGIVSAEQVLLAGANGRPITYIYNWFHDYPIAIVASVEAGILTIADLKGKTVGIPMRSGATYTGLTALLETSDLTESDIDLQEIGFNAPEAFCLGRVQAASVYVNNEPLQIQTLIDAGQCGDVTAIRVFPVSEVLPLVSNGIITNNDFLLANPDLLASFVAAYHQALLDTINNPARAYLYSLLHVGNLPISAELRSELEAEADAQDVFLTTAPTREAVADSRTMLYTRLHSRFDAVTLLQMDILLRTIDLWDTEAVGITESTSWENMTGILTSLEQLPADATELDRLYTNDFVPEPTLAP